MASASDYRAHAALQPADCLILLPQRLPAAVETSIRPAHYPAECTQSDAFLQPSLRAPNGRANSNSLCFNGNFLVDRSEYPPLASRVLTSSGVAALLRLRDAYAQDGAQGHLSSEGLGGDPKHRGAIRPKPQCKLSRMSQLLTIYTNPGYKQSCLCAFVHN